MGSTSATSRQGKPERPIQHCWFAVGRLSVRYRDISGILHDVVFVLPEWRDRWMLAQYGARWRVTSRKHARLAAKPLEFN
jgi:hypothetical protein